MLFDSYPRAKQIVDQLNYHEHVQNTNWLQMSKDEAAISLASVILTKNALNGSSIPLKKIGAIQVDNEYNEIGNKSHVLTKEEGRAQVHLTNEEVTKLYAHIELGGQTYQIVMQTLMQTLIRLV